MPTIPEVARAAPTKAFFIENIIRDLTLEDAILDLVDNSIDSAIQVKDLDVSANLLRVLPSPDRSKTRVDIKIKLDEIRIIDKAGGIDPERARDDVFRLGRPPSKGDSTLGVFGIGLKRAVFKMGRHITVDSWHADSGFRVEITPEWMSNEDDWDLPIRSLPRRKQTGTEITIKELRPEIVLRLKDPALLNRLRAALSRTYALFINHLVSIRLNEVPINGEEIPLGQSDEVFSGKKELQVDGVGIELLTGLQPRVDSRWEMEKAGWYVLCNGRVVVFADKSDLTGWGGAAGPQFNPKHRGFVGVAFFFSDDPSQLPWTTTKRGLNRESPVFQLARHEMVAAARPVLTFLNNMYASDAPEPEAEKRRLADTVRVVPLYKLAATDDRTFSSKERPKAQRPAIINVQFKALKADIERAKKCIGKPKWGASKVGLHALEYFLDQECGE